jgi:hypothetical protein
VAKIFLAGALRLFRGVSQSAPSNQYAKRHGFRPNLEELGDRVVPAVGSISGRVFQDVTGNGLSADDRGLGGVTVRLFRDSDRDGVLSDGDRLVSSKSSAVNGAYSFDNLRAGQYFVTEKVPRNFVRTGPALGAYYTIDLGDGEHVAGQHFDNYQKPNRSAMGRFSFTLIHADGTQSTVNNLRNKTRPGDTVIANFTIARDARPVVVSLVSYNAPGPTFDPNTASQQTIYQNATGTYGPGQHSLTVRIPDDCYQVDFVLGYAIDQFGPAGSNIFFTPQGRLLSADNGGSCDCDDPPSETGSLSGRVFVDLNQNGALDAAEGDLALAGVQVDLYLYDASGNATFVRSVDTDADGNYIFTDLAAGTYQLVEQQPAGRDDGLDYIGTVDGVPSGIQLGSLGSDEISQIVLGAGQQGINYNFTELAGTGSLSGRVVTPDENSGNGFIGMPDVFVVLTYVNDQGITVTLTVQTDLNGDFHFAGLGAETYTITQVVPDGYTANAAIAGTVNGEPNGQVVDPTTIENIVLGDDEDGFDYEFRNFVTV